MPDQKQDRIALGTDIVVEALRERLYIVYAQDQYLDIQRKFPVAVEFVVVAVVAGPDLERSCNIQASLIAVISKQFQLDNLFIF